MTALEQVLVIIPARGGSKRIPGKNIKKINGKSMITWPLIELKKSICKKNILVSTDDIKIVQEVKKLDIEVPFMRPKKISGDKSTTLDVAKHALSWYEKKNDRIKYVLIVYPTSVFFKNSNLVDAYKHMKKNKNCSVLFSAAKYTHPIQRSFSIKKKKLKMLYTKSLSHRTQDLETFFHDVGQFYFCRSEIIRSGKKIINESAEFILFPKYQCIDIDDLDDFKLAEILLKKNKLRNK